MPARRARSLGSVFKLLLALHLLFAIFAIGPLVHAATTAARGVRTGDGAATASSARMLRIYSYASVLVVIVRHGPDVDRLAVRAGQGRRVQGHLDLAVGGAWLVAVALTLFVLVPTLTKATETIGSEGSVVTLTGAWPRPGGVVGLIFAGIVFLMVYRPGG